MEGPLASLLDTKEIRRLFRSFTLATGLSVTVLDAEGRSVQWEHSAQNEQFACAFCRGLQAHAEGLCCCMEDKKRGGAYAAKLGEPYIYRCHAGLVEIASPVLYGHIFIGSLSCGGVQMWDWDEAAQEEYAQRMQCLGLRKEALLESRKNVRVLSSVEVQAAADLLFVTVSYIAQTGMELLRQRRELNQQQAEIAELLYGQKWREEKLQRLEGNLRQYPLEKEQELLALVRRGDRNGARSMLNDLLGEIYFYGGGDFEQLKARMLELVVVISRAAVDSGASLSTLLGMNYHFIAELAAMSEQDEMAAWVVRALDSFMDAVYNTRDRETFLQEAIRYIRANFMRPLTLETVAAQVFISPYHLSHSFKEELHMTFIEYLTKLRIEQACRLLSTTKLPATQIAQEVGYEDSSYFSKVFKRMMGRSPNQYRKKG